MKVYIANFGRGNQLWPACLQQSTVATYEDEDLRPFWLAGDREGYIARCMAAKRTAAGISPPRQVASRWFNLATVVSTTESDIWIHREKDELWWTTTLAGEAAVSLQPAFDSDSVERIYVIQKPAKPWTDRSTQGTRLRWSTLHPRAREFLFTEGTLQQLSEENAAYAFALIEGRDLERWHRLPSWKGKADRAGKADTRFFTATQKAAVRMAKTAQDTVAASNGQQVQRIVKNKEIRFPSQKALEDYILALIKSQDGLCALTNLPLQYDGEHDDADLLCSLDRIDSDGHYEPNNLQVVCRFANRWKSDSDDASFRRLLGLVRAHQM